MDWKHLLAYITGTVDQELLLRNEYLVTENRILRNQITGRVRLTDGERKTWRKSARSWGRKPWRKWRTSSNLTRSCLAPQAVAQKFDGSTQRKAPGRPTIDRRSRP